MTSRLEFYLENESGIFMTDNLFNNSLVLFCAQADAGALFALLKILCELQLYEILLLLQIFFF